MNYLPRVVPFLTRQVLTFLAANLEDAVPCLLASVLGLRVPWVYPPGPL